VRSAQAGWKARGAQGTQFFQADALAKIPWLVHGFSTRIGLATWNTPAAVAANRRLLLAAVGAPHMPLASLRQVHSDVAHVVGPPRERQSPDWRLPVPAGDAAITRCAGVLVSVQSADCVPVLLADTRRRIVAAVHAGWRGTLARVTVKTLGRMQQEFGTRPQDIVAALGPAIGGCCYQVGPEVARAFASQFACAAEWFDGPFAQLAWGDEPNPLPWLNMMPPGHQPEPERVNLDLRAANRRQLVDAGVPAKRIAVSALCTRCRADLFFSYRREGPGTGRLMAVIGIRGKAAKRAARENSARPAASRQSRRAIR
jgi:purine-nucleoside/S-methyl-5'-thioadenosine phosphorylase / adenosine deaminase